ncbi:hypothetical protein TNCV_3796041 [Trichonephila clavipes]|nr:hypothetical protein TNCV_3796041 [Trichonephila clavipes]
MFDGLDAFAVDRWLHDCSARKQPHGGDRASELTQTQGGVTESELRTVDPLAHHMCPREAGWWNRRIGRHLGADMVVARVGKVDIFTVGSGRPRNTNDREDRAIRRVATSAPTTSLASIQRHLPPSRHPVPSRETIRRRLTEV